MAISDPVLRYLESRKNLTGSACGLVGLALTLTGAAGSLWPVVVAGLYGAGALFAPPERPPAPAFPDAAEQLDALRTDLATLRAYLTEVELPPAAAGHAEAIRQHTHTAYLEGRTERHRPPKP